MQAAARWMPVMDRCRSRRHLFNRYGLPRVSIIRQLRLSRSWILALVLCAGCLYLLATISLTIEASEDETLQGDVAVSRVVQGTSFPGLQELVGVLNIMGNSLPLALLAGVVAAGLLAYRRYAEALLVLPTMFTHALNYGLKNLAASPRPTPDLVRVTEHASGFGFPSGHTMSTVVFCGVMIYVAWRVIENRPLQRTVQALAVLAIVGIGFSRVYSGAHWPSDVLGGYLWGAFYTTLLLVGFHRLRPVSVSASASA